MANIIDYVRSCKDTFEDRAPTRVDSLVFSWLANMRIPEAVPSSLTPQGASITDIFLDTNVLDLVAPLHDPKSSETLLSMCATSQRFSQTRACLAADEWSERDVRQFSATTFLLPHGAFIAIRGTDDTLIGWKENLQMAYLPTIPAQKSARAYLEDVASKVDGPLWIGGHSKGGNLAVYAAMTCSPQVRARIQACFTHDGPGFLDETLADPAWAGDTSIVDRTVVEDSLFGLLFAHQDPAPIVVRTSTPGIFGHSPFSWIVEGDDFATTPGVSYDAHRNGKRLNAWILAMSTDERERFIEILCKLARSTGEMTFSGLGQSIANGSLDIMLRRLDGLSDDDRQLFYGQIEELVATMLLGPAPTRPETPEEHVDAAADKLDDISAKFNDSLSKLEKYGR